MKRMKKIISIFATIALLIACNSCICSAESKFDFSELVDDQIIFNAVNLSTGNTTSLEVNTASSTDSATCIGPIRNSVGDTVYLLETESVTDIVQDGNNLILQDSPDSSGTVASPCLAYDTGTSSTEKYAVNKTARMKVTVVWELGSTNQTIWARMLRSNVEYTPLGQSKLSDCEIIATYYGIDANTHKAVEYSSGWHAAPGMNTNLNISNANKLEYQQGFYSPPKFVGGGKCYVSAGTDKWLFTATTVKTLTTP